MWVSRMLKTGIQYLPVDSIQTSRQSCARSQSRREAISELVVLKTLVLYDGFFMYIEADALWVYHFELVNIHKRRPFAKG